MRRTLLYFVLAAATGCWSHPIRTLATGDILLDTTALVVQPTSPILAKGPTREVCLVPATPADDRAIQGPEEWPNERTPVTVVLWGAGGVRDTLGHDLPGSHVQDAATMPMGDDGVCLWDHGLTDSTGGATYIAVELRSRVPVRIRRIGFWSGRRTGFI